MAPGSGGFTVACGVGAVPVVQQRWSYHRADHSQASHHPASRGMRGLAFRDGHRRHSVGVVDGKDRQLIRTASIREDQRGYPGAHWRERTRQITWPSPPNREVYFPNRIVLPCPERLQIIRADYGAGARLTRLQHQLLRRAPRPAASSGCPPPLDSLE